MKYGIEEIERMLEEAERSGYVCPACGNVHVGNTSSVIRSRLAELKESRKAAFLEAADVADYEYEGYGENLPSTRAICMTIADNIRSKAEE